MNTRLTPKVLLIGAAVVVGVLIYLGARMFVLYRNRYGKRLILRKDVYARFQAMKTDLERQGIDLEMTDAWRGQADQNTAKAGGFSMAGWGQSPHNFGVAFDVAPVINGGLTWTPPAGVWAKIGAAGKANGLTWGGSFTTLTDLPHFELSGWKDQRLALLPVPPTTLPA